MKKATILLAMLLLSCIAVKAQEHRYEARLGWVPLDVFNLIYLLGENPGADITYGPVKTVGIFSADFDINLKKRMTVGAKVSYRKSWRSTTTTIDDIKVRGIDRMEALSIMPTVKATTGFNSMFRYYATLGAGVGMDFSDDGNTCFPAFQFTPVGIAVGRKVSWYFELGLGNAFLGMITGISWRF